MVGNIKYQQAERNASGVHSFSVSVFEWSRGTRPNHDHNKLSSTTAPQERDITDLQVPDMDGDSLVLVLLSEILRT